MSVRTDKERLKSEIMLDVRRLLATVGGGGDVTDLGVGTVANGEVVGNVGGVLVGVSPSAPGLHAATHQNGGADEISLTGLSGVAADPQPPIIGAGATQAVAGNDARLTNARTPTAHAASHAPGGTDALAVDAAAGTGSLRTLGAGATQAVSGTDFRLTNARTPTLHAAEHAATAVDEINVTSLHGLLADAQTPLAHTHVLADLPAALITDVELATELADYVDFTAFDDHSARHENGGADEISVAGLSGLLADPQTPAAHTTSHLSGGTDAIKLDDLAAPDDNTDLNASAAKHGLLPKLSGNVAQVLRGDGTFGSAPPAALGLTTVEVSFGAAPTARRSGKVQITGLAGLTIGKPVLIQQATGPYTGKGTRADEAELDQLLMSAVVSAADKIDVYWKSQHRVRGNFKLNYVVST